MDFGRNPCFPGARVAALLLGFAWLAGCTFVEGPDWPPLTPTEPAKKAARAKPGAGKAAPKWRSLANFARGKPAPAPPGGGAVLVGAVRPLVVIRFPSGLGEGPGDGATAGQAASYETGLYQVLKRTLKLRPETAFDMVAVSAGLDGSARQGLTGHTRAVLRALDEMGLPAERLSLSATSVPGVAGSEVHLYVR